MPLGLRGYSIVYSGRRSIQFSLHVQRRALDYASYTASNVERLSGEPRFVSALMHRAHSKAGSERALISEARSRTLCTTAQNVENLSGLVNKPFENRGVA
jgi:hypothetical protein